MSVCAGGCESTAPGSAVRQGPSRHQQPEGGVMHVDGVNRPVQPIPIPSGPLSGRIN